MRLLQVLGLLTYVFAIHCSNFDLYDEIQLLYNLGQMQQNLPISDFYPDESQYTTNKLDDDWSEMYPDTLSDASPKEARDYGEAVLRDQEYMKQLPISGYQFISGGTGRQEEPSEVKTDKVLPAYCTPPNPCPHGYTGGDNCVKVFENSPDNNRRILEEQDCPCDAEHMLSCPPGKKTIDPKSGFVNTGETDDGLGTDLGNTLGSLDSVNMDTREDLENLGLLNPYLEGIPKNVVSKKQAPRYDEFN